MGHDDSEVEDDFEFDGTAVFDDEEEEGGTGWSKWLTPLPQSQNLKKIIKRLWDGFLDTAEV